MIGRRGIEIKTPDQLRLMRRAGQVVAEVHRALTDAAAPGVTTRDLDELARDVLARRGAQSSFLGYGAGWGYPPYPAVTCISVNEEIVHGIPGGRVLAHGDLVSVDFGAIVDGWHGDGAVTFGVGDLAAADARLSEVTRESLWAGIGAARLGGRIGDISAAVEASVRAHPENYGLLREYSGHGIGSAMHQPPDVPNEGRAGKGPRIVEGMALAIEPMVTRGSSEGVVLDDEWTVASSDGSRAAHWEHTITVTPKGLWVLTALDGGESELVARGLPFGPLAD
ncbi:type I methionyl aminopeptidase [Propioniciclava sp.]|uniref:type I methionyl aminopeptidase n=1 Tax=Propioniciclava sp. TaxID=2038686 RepID=UPI002634EAA8|nr:type I methionyl aminopeptidase [Propioniciclava sp.]